MRNSYPLCRNGFQCFNRTLDETPLKKPKGIRGTRHLRFAPVVGKADAPETALPSHPASGAPTNRRAVRMLMPLNEVIGCLFSSSKVSPFRDKIYRAGRAGKLLDDIGSCNR